VGPLIGFTAQVFVVGLNWLEVFEGWLGLHSQVRWTYPLFRLLTSQLSIIPWPGFRILNLPTCPVEASITAYFLFHHFTFTLPASRWRLIVPENTSLILFSRRSTGLDSDEQQAQHYTVVSANPILLTGVQQQTHMHPPTSLRPLKVYREPLL
jgi:hypothetical protein